MFFSECWELYSALVLLRLMSVKQGKIYTPLSTVFTSELLE